MFSGVLWTCLCLCFWCYNFFFDTFIVNFKQVSNLDLLLSVISFVLSPEEAARGAPWKKCSLKLRNIYRKLPVLQSLFSKVGHLACSYIKKGLQHRYFLRNLQKFSRTPFLKNIFERMLLSRLLGWVKVKKITERSSQ